MNSTEVTHRRLTYEEAEVLAHEIRLIPGITAYLPGELIKLPHMFVLERNRQLVGVIAYVESEKFIDLKMFMIREADRGKGYGRQLFECFTTFFANASKPIYTVTKNQAVIHLVKRAGYKNVRFLGLPWSCMLHQLNLIYSWYRIQEYVRKRIYFPHNGRFSYWIKY